MSERRKILILNPPQEVDSDFIDYPHFTGLPAWYLAERLTGCGHHVHVLDALAVRGADYFPLRNERGLFGVPHVSLLEPLRDADFDVAVIHFTPFVLSRRSEGLAYLLRRMRQWRPHSLLVGAELYTGGMHRVPTEGVRLRSDYPELDRFVSLEGERTLPNVVLETKNAVPFLVPGEVPDATLLAECSVPSFSSDWLAGSRAFLDRVGRLAKLRQYAVDGSALPVHFSRGCPFSCSFCTSPYRNYRAVPLPQVETFLARARVAGIERLFVLDDAANVRKDFPELLAMVDNAGMRLVLPNGLRADLLDRETVSALSRVTGELTVSAESASPRVQRELVGKSVTVDQVRQVAQWCSEVSLPLLVHWTVGFETETREEALATLEVARTMLDDYGARPLVQFPTPLPGTRLAAATGTGRSTKAMQHEPTWTPIGVEPDEFVRAVSLLRARASQSRAAKVIVNVTYRCNNHCVFCAVGNRSQQDLPADEIRRILERHWDQGIRQLDLDGGEPTLHPDLFEIIRFSVDKGFAPINVTTNGRRMAYPEFARALLTSGITGLLISLHGASAQVHDGITGSPGSFAETVQGLRNAVRLAPKSVDFGVNTTLSTRNFERLDALVELLAGLSVPRLNIQFLTPFGRAAAELVPDPDEAAAVVRRVIERWRDRMAFQVVNLPYCHLPGLEEYVAQDLGKLSRTMVFVTREEVNLYRYLAQTRRYDDSCRGCLYRVACDGRYDFAEVQD
ncbi:MAG: radical SAM protein [Deltaproteobacteria bacterium]|nr:radical SAM protein [Deltaproteobacteria bacterium]